MVFHMRFFHGRFGELFFLEQQLCPSQIWVHLGNGIGGGVGTTQKITGQAVGFVQVHTIYCLMGHAPLKHYRVLGL